MERLAVALFIAGLLSGCATTPEPSESPGPKPSDGVAGQTLHFEGVYSLQVYEAGAAGTYQIIGFQQPGNCILIEGNPEILRGKATARWDPSTLSPMELAFGIGDGEAIHEVMAEPGAGVSQLTFEDLFIDGEGWLSWQNSRRGLGGASPGTPAEVELAFEYRLPDPANPLVIDPGYTCSI